MENMDLTRSHVVILEKKKCMKTNIRFEGLNIVKRSSLCTSQIHKRFRQHFLPLTIVI